MALQAGVITPTYVTGFNPFDCAYLLWWLLFQTKSKIPMYSLNVLRQKNMVTKRCKHVCVCIKDKIASNQICKGRQFSFKEHLCILNEWMKHTYIAYITKSSFVQERNMWWIRVESGKEYKGKQEKMGENTNIFYIFFMIVCVPKMCFCVLRFSILNYFLGFMKGPLVPTLTFSR